MPKRAATKISTVAGYHVVLATLLLVLSCSGSIKITVMHQILARYNLYAMSISAKTRITNLYMKSPFPCSVNKGYKSVCFVVFLYFYFMEF